MRKRKLGATSKQWLKSIHLICSVIWLGSVVSMNLLRWVWEPVGNGDLYAIDHAISLIDQWIVLFSALGALLTGFLESWLTTWSFFKYRWVTIKWIVTGMVLLFGALFQRIWLKELETISQVEGLRALQNPVYLQVRLQDTIAALVMISALTILPFISVLKPWVKWDKLKMLKQRKGSTPKPLSGVQLEPAESD